MAAALGLSGLRGGPLRASVAKIDITPSESKPLIGYAPRQSDGVLHRIYHRVVCLDDGKQQLFVVSSEFCAISPSVYDEITETLERDHGIDRMSVWWTLTHTHAAPEVGPSGLAGAFLGKRYEDAHDEVYTEQVKESFVEAVLEAKERLQPARLGVGWGYSRANVNRRARTADGQIRLGVNPDGPVDRRIGIIKLDTEEGRPLALIANYAIHGTVMGGDFQKISGDAPGVVSQYVEQETGVPLLFINGAAGNLAPVYSVLDNRRAYHLDEFEVLLGDPIVDAAERIEANRNEISMAIGEVVVETPMKAGVRWPDSLESYAGVDENGGDVVRLPVRVMEIDDDLAIWGAPVELFCEISNEIRERSPFSNTFYFGYSNGWMGYLLTEREWLKGGYESRVTPFTGSAEADLIDAVTGYLNNAKEAKK